MKSFNTASGKYCCNYWAGFYGSKKSHYVSIPQAVSTVATTEDNIETVYCIIRLVSIPQAVSTVATLNKELGRRLFTSVSIPQAVSTVATEENKTLSDKELIECFNTASGKYCCNRICWKSKMPCLWVSIPQAVSTVATFLFNAWIKSSRSSAVFQYRKR